MPRHQIYQLPAMLVLGLVSGWWFSKKVQLNMSGGITGLIFTMASLVFWMLPRSIDLSVIKPAFNRMMHLNIFVVGFFLVPAFKNFILELRILFLGMLAAMCVAVGYTLTKYDSLLCSSFDIGQQRQTGHSLIIIGVILLVMVPVVFFKEVGKEVR